MKLRMMGIQVIDEQEDEIGTPSSSSSNSFNDSTNYSTIATSASSDSFENATASPSSSSFSPGGKRIQKINPLYRMSDLMEQLPVKRGLSRYFQGKSQSFSSLSNARRLEDLVKPLAKPCRKRPKSCRSHGAGLDHPGKPLSPHGHGCSSRIISKKPPSSTTAVGKRYHHRQQHHHSNIGLHAGRPPTHHHHCSDNPSGQALLIA